MAQSILVIGGTGNTGRHIVQKLLQHGYAARVLARNIHAAREQFDPQVEVVAGDITQPASVAAAMHGVAGCVIIVESSTSDAAPNSPERVHFQGTRHVLAAAAEQQAHIVLVTQIYIARPERFPEMRNIIHWRGQAEQAVRTSNVPYTIVRPSWLTNEPASRAAIRFEQGDTGDGQISREDVAEVCVQSLLVPEAQGKTFEIYNEPGTPPLAWQPLFQQLAGDVTGE
ncbi:nucleoside-diphosphate sugar epimerase [Dictyobacter alpinus]|uniref:Nucleoside-diphosphate sugar epimerase n=1 Tax=Dictyobacter alpinus TaxID=2014873 RepID=A0A402BCQ7_9CHLR|nr:SDR family oxidoreductase [Dictyobacter alpinus]GCE29062.1 nucleoside-diphosphate sugar epimerase [Dictyobacter alpinus]